jgi:hypothetical protein
MARHMAVVKEPADDLRPGKSHANGDRALFGDPYGIPRPVEGHRLVIDRDDLEMHLMDVEFMEIAGLIDQPPFLDRPEGDADVHAVMVEQLTIDEEPFRP